MTKRRPMWPVLTLFLCPLLSAGHCGNPCDPDDINVSAAEVSEGTLTWENGGTLTEVVETRVFPRPSTCTLGATMGSSDNQGQGAISAIIDDARLPFVHGHFDIRCFSFEDPKFFSLSLTTSDPRDWPEGELDAEALEAQVRLTSRACDASGDCEFCVAEVPNAAVTVVVESAQGGSAGFPDGVTEDFARAIRVEIDTGEALVGASSGEACGLPMSAQATAAFAWDREDFAFVENCPQGP